MSILENQENSKTILNIFKSRLPVRSKILDICCGAFTNGINYDPTGQIYEPHVAQMLGRAGFDVVGLDHRLNKPGIPIFYNHVSNIDLHDPKWPNLVRELAQFPFDGLVFMRSWDTPELLLSLQEKVGQFDLNHLNFLMAEHYLPIFAKLVKPGGYLITSEIFNLGLEEDAEVKRLNTAQILTNFNWLVLQSSGGLYLAKLRN